LFVILLNMKKQLNIKIPKNVSVNISPNNIEIKGKLGQLSLNKKEQFNCELDIQKNILVLKVGFCNNISFEVPDEITIFLESPTQITLFSIDYLLVKQTAASLRSFRRPDAYKGKGFQYLSEVLVLKEVKKNG